MKTISRGVGAAHPVLFGLGRASVRFEGENDGKPGAGTPPPPGTPPAPPPAKPFAEFPDADTFNKRMEREAKRILKEQGIEDPAAVKAQLDEYAKLKAAQEEERKKQMSEADRLREERDKAAAERTSAMSRAEEAELRAHCYQVFASKGIKNFDYALWKLTQKLSEIGDDGELDEAAWLDEQLKDPATAAAFGLATTPPPPPARQGVTNTEPGKPPPPPPPGGGNGEEKTAMDMNKQDFQKHVQAKYGFGV